MLTVLTYATETTSRKWKLGNTCGQLGLSTDFLLHAQGISRPGMERFQPCVSSCKVVFSAAFPVCRIYFSKTRDLAFPQAYFGFLTSSSSTLPLRFGFIAAVSSLHPLFQLKCHSLEEVVLGFLLPTLSGGSNWPSVWIPPHHYTSLLVFCI